MVIYEQGAILIATLVLYFGMMAWLLYRGQPLIAAGVMFMVALFPLAWDAIAYPDSEAPGSGLLTALLFIPALLLLLCELCAWALRLLLRKARLLFLR